MIFGFWSRNKHIFFELLEHTLHGEGPFIGVYYIKKKKKATLAKASFCGPA